PEIVFVTAHDRFAVDAFDLNAADYLLKPVRLHRLRQAVEKVRRRRQAPTGSPAVSEPFLWAPTREGRARVAEASIRWIEAEKDHALLHTPARSYMVRTTMGELARALRDPDLVRVHRSAIVRLGAVASVKRRRKAISLVLDDGRIVPVGPSYAAETLRRLSLAAV
ncbi:MAG TPA: LytTR family DNA-binding domain-containing protein, partial [Caulobacteraceae bacterium]|nr:LytTR family DNA-binding domain-containing protein [Caulobacteraceae bacterium]